MAFASAAGNYCNYEVIYGLEQRANEVWRDVLQKKLEEQVNISSQVGNDTSTIPVGNVLILLKDIYKILQKELLSNMQKANTTHLLNT